MVFIMNDLVKHKIEHNARRAVTSVKWVVFAILVGVVVGICGTAFYFGLSFVTLLRTQNPWLIFLLPVGGLAIVGLYHLFKDEDDSGTNLVISAIYFKINFCTIRSSNPVSLHLLNLLWPVKLVKVIKKSVCICCNLKHPLL